MLKETSESFFFSNVDCVGTLYVQAFHRHFRNIKLFVSMLVFKFGTSNLFSLDERYVSITKRRIKMYFVVKGCFRGRKN